jgi:Fe-S oxidoreductase
LSGTFYKVYSAILDAAAIALVVGVVWAVIRRYGQAPWRLRSKTKAEDAWILTVLGLIGVTGVFTEAARIAVDGRPDFEVWSFVGYPLSSLFPASTVAGWHQFFWIFHVVTFVWFLVILPTTKLRHMVTSPANMFLAPNDRPKGAMKALPNLMEATDIESLGASVITDLTWKQIFDTDACTVCGRCTSVCPANMTGKPLDPREMVLKVGEVAASTAPARISMPVSMDAEITIDTGSLFDRVTPEELWSCTTCRACDAICPVNIEILDKILDMRRYKALMEADFPTELGKAFVALENQGNPWGLSQQSRMDWARDLDFEVKVLGDDGVESADYLYWVGCAGSFDDRNVEVTKATARLLHEAGIDFAVLGPKESCTGDPARRSGNEYLYQQLALSNIETLNDLGVERVITQCPHCFNSLANDYPQLGGDYEVVHHSQLLMELVGNGSLDPTAATGATPQITFHDPCYLGRYNDVYLAPREVVCASGASLVEMERNGTNSMCCGAGGARFWMEEQTGKKVNVERAEQAIATGADEVAVGCPFCYVMIDDGIKELGSEMRVRDISMILAGSVFKK